MTMELLTQGVFADIFKELSRYQVLPEEHGPYSFVEKDGLVHILDKNGHARGHMPKDVYEDILKMELK